MYMDDTKTILIPDEVRNLDYHMAIVADNLSNDITPEAKPYIDRISEIVQQFYNEEIKTRQAFRLIDMVLIDYDINIIIPREEQEQKERLAKEELYIDNPFDITELAIKNTIHEHDIFEKGFLQIIRTIGIENLQITDSKGNLITDIEQLKGGNQRKKADTVLRQYLDYKNRPDLKRYALEITDVFDEPIITVFLGQGQAHSGFYLNRLSPIIVELFLAMKENDTMTTTYARLAEKIKLVNHNYNVYSNIDYNPDSDYLIDQAHKFNELFNQYQFRQFYKNAYNVINKIIRDLLRKLDKSYSAIRVKENHLIYAKDQDGEEYSFTTDDVGEEMIRHAQAAVLQEMKIPTIGRVFLLRKAPQFFSRVIDYINKEYGENWTHYLSQIEITIISRSQLQKCYDEYIAKHNDTEVSLQECREKIKARLTKMVNSDVSRAEKKYKETHTRIKAEMQQKFDNTTDIQNLVDCGVYTEKDKDKKVENWTKSEEIKSKVFTGFAPNYKDIQAEIMRFLIDTADNQQ